MTHNGVPVLPPDLDTQHQILSAARKHPLTIDEFANWDDVHVWPFLLDAEGPMTEVAPRPAPHGEEPQA